MACPPNAPPGSRWVTPQGGRGGWCVDRDGNLLGLDGRPIGGDGGTTGGDTSGSNDCDCANTAYRYDHRCYVPCGGVPATEGREAPGGGGGGDDHAWYVREIQSKPNVFDTGISEGQWIAWRSFWDDASKSFRSENVDHDGNPITGTGFSKPVDCPDGTTKFNVNQCLPLNDRRITSAWGTQPAVPGGTGTGGTVKTSGVGTAVPATKGLTALSQVPYTGQELHDVLANFFNYRSGIFGMNDPNLSGATARTTKGQDIKAFDLPGGGLWWGEGKGLSDALAPFGTLFNSSKQPSGVTATAVPTPKPATTHTCPAGFTWNASTGACMPEVTGRPAQVPVEFTGPLAAALSTVQRQQKII